MSETVHRMRCNVTTLDENPDTIPSTIAGSVLSVIHAEMRTNRQDGDIVIAEIRHNMIREIDHSQLEFIFKTDEGMTCYDKVAIRFIKMNTDGDEVEVHFRKVQRPHFPR
jgi:hypothetical protein